MRKFLNSPVTGADGSPLYLDNGRPVTTWMGIAAAIGGTATILLGIKAFFLAFAIAAVLDGAL